MGFCDQKVGFCIFRAVVMIACLSKYDFWNLHKISDWYEKKFFKKIFFWNRKKSRKKVRKKFWEIFRKKIWNFQNSLRIFQKSWFWKIIFFQKSLRNFENFGKFSKNLPKKGFQSFFEIFFYFEKKYFEIFFLKSIRNFPKIPKIAFRKAGNERKCSKNAKSTFLNTESENLVSFGNVLCITTL